MKFPLKSLVQKLPFEKLLKKPNQTKVRIDEVDETSEVVKIDKIGLDVTGSGVVILKTDEGREFPISAFSPDVAKHMSDFLRGAKNELPTIYNMIEDICEQSEIFLVKVRIYDTGSALRANLYFTGKKEAILRNYRASDAIALALFYDIPILLKKSLLQQNPKIS